MDCLVALLPSEIARLVYGYLLSEKCTTAAQSFLDESPNLQECRKVAYSGKPFTTRVSNWALLDILETFCQVNYIVQETADKFNRPDKLKHSNDLVGKIQFLLEIYACHQSTLDGDVPLTNIVQNPPLVHEFPLKNGQDPNEGCKTVSEKISQNLEIDSQRSVSPSSATNTEDETISQVHLETKKTQSHFEDNENHIELLNSKRDSKEAHLKQTEYSETDSINQEVQKTQGNSPHNVIEQSKKYMDSEVQTSLALLKDSPIDSTKQKLQKCTQSEIKILEIEGGVNEQYTPTIENTEHTAEHLADLVDQVNSTPTCPKSNDHEPDILKSNYKSLSGPRITSIENLDPQSSFYQLGVNARISLPIKQTKLPSFTSCFRYPRITEPKNQNSHNAMISSTVTTDENSVGNLIRQKNLTKETHVIQKYNEKDDMINDQSAAPSHGDLNEEIFGASENNAEDDSKIVEEETCNFKSPSKLHRGPPKSDDFFSHNNTLTSTPLKPLAHQNFDICNWFSSEISTPSTVQYSDVKLAGVGAKNLVAQTTNKTIDPTSINAISPIISTATCHTSEITTSNPVLTDAVQGSALLTEKVECSSRDAILCNMNLESPPHENKTHLMQKSSGELDELLNPPNLQKSNGSAINPSPVSKSTSDLNRILGIDSIMLYGMDNNATSLQIPLAIQEIEMEDSITFTGTGLSPFLKKLNSSQTDHVPEKKCNGKTHDNFFSPKAPAVTAGDTALTSNAKTSQKKFNIDEVIKYNTPQSLKENRTKNKRTSFTSPKKPNSCVRALNFDNNLQKCKSDGKIQDQEGVLSPPSLRKEIVKSKSCRMSLFRSPPHDNLNLGQKLDNDSNVMDVETPLSIETTECANEPEKEKGDVDDDLIPKRRSSSKENDDNIVLERPRGNGEKKSWDSDLRRYLCIPEPPPSKTRVRTRNRNRKRPSDDTEQVSPPKRAKKSKKSDKKPEKSKDKTSAEKKTCEQERADNNEEEDRESTKIHEGSQPEMESTEKERDSLEMILSDSINNGEILDEEAVQKLASQELENLNKLKGIDTKNESSEKDDSGIAEKMQLDEESLTSAFKKISDELAAKYFSNQKSEPVSQNQEEQQCPEATSIEVQGLQESPDMVYAKIEKQLKEITGSGGNSQRQPIYDEVTQTSADGKLVQKKYARVRTLKPGEAPSAANCLLGLEDSPRKDEDSLQVPPTPRVLSPGSSMLVMPLSKHSEDSHTLASFVTTTPLECPLTPGIVLTPPKPASTAARSLSAGIAIATSATSVPTDESSQPLSTAFKTSSSAEITKFEVIQENFFKPNKVQLEIETISTTACVSEEPVESTEDENIIKTDATSSTSIGSRSCSTCSPSTSASEDENNNGSDSEDETEREVTDRNQTEDEEKEQEDVMKDEREFESIRQEAVVPEVSRKKRKPVDSISENVSSIIEKAGEISPTKLLLNENQKFMIGNMSETPAKDEICQEADIFETPSTSKSLENRTNLNNKISEMLVIKEHEATVEKMKNIEFDVTEIAVKPQLECSSEMEAKVSMVRNKPRETANQRIILEKSEDEIAKAIESITVLEEEKIRQVQEDLEMSVDSCIASSPHKDDTCSKKELVRAIESITKLNYGAEDSIDESSSEENLKIVVVDEGGDEPKEKESKNDGCLDQSIEHPHNTRSKSRQISHSNECDSKFKPGNVDGNEEIHIEYEYNEEKKRRRKGFRDNDLIVRNLFIDDPLTIYPTKFETMFDMKPARKKPAQRKHLVGVNEELKANQRQRRRNGRRIYMFTTLE
ncbi:hypothetical protein QAD02_022138 [Eretmocerus hayati]|uniref:Uncharacterized protein n=1 Tax=Eretmocerus hayati TaxID=131215 RepID=A0ACC2PUM9_9HYME|nr:hypothetical protein QAD02_022138 [Eretmocerus hayati]